MNTKIYTATFMHSCYVELNIISEDVETASTAALLLLEHNCTIFKHLHALVYFILYSLNTFPIMVLLVLQLAEYLYSLTQILVVYH